MVETDHPSKLICIFYKAMLFGIVLELLQMSVINLLSYQSFNHLFKQKPSKRDQRKWITLHNKPLFLLFTMKIAIPSPREQVLINPWQLLQILPIILTFSWLSFQIANNESARTMKEDLSRLYVCIQTIDMYLCLQQFLEYDFLVKWKPSKSFQNLFENFVKW